ncbi:MAG TPA: hypothetical protein VJ964_03210 [Balneolaceae bacterium]|nr:hypothetical protein [Balneolaceae bacterium]
MRKRKRKTTTKPKDKIIEAGRKWRQAVIDRDWQAAIQARQSVDELFEANPEYLDSPPYCEKALYLDWKYFTHFNNERYRAAYRQAVEKNKWPPKMN